MTTAHAIIQHSHGCPEVLQWRKVEVPDPAEPVGCRCGDVLRGVIDPPECPLFDAGCDPDTAIGACMVSSEGTCAAWYRHERWAEEAVS